MKFYNAFGIKPTNTYTSAGTDYYIPNLNEDSKIEKALTAFKKSYKKTTEDIQQLIKYFDTVLDELYPEVPKQQIPNLVHLFLALYDAELEQRKQYALIQGVYCFVDEFMVYDKANDKVGIKVRLNDTLFINSGIKVALDTVLSDKTGTNPTHLIHLFRLLGIGVAGLYVNKSGMGNRGFDTRAVLVDEDYSGYVHLSMAYTKEVLEFSKDNVIWCGDKLTQMMLIPVFHDEYIDTDEEEYNKIMANSQRGDKGFGSSDVKH